MPSLIIFLCHLPWTVIIGALLRAVEVHLVFEFVIEFGVFVWHVLIVPIYEVLIRILLTWSVLAFGVVSRVPGVAASFGIVLVRHVVWLSAGCFGHS